MKRTLLLTLLFTALLFIGRSCAQHTNHLNRKDTLSKISFGIKLGAQFNKITDDETFQQHYRPGIVGGAYVASTRKKWGIKAEALISSSRYDLQNDSIHNNAYFSAIYLNVIALPEYEIIPHLWLQAGLQFSTFISVAQHPPDAFDAKNYFQPRDFSGVVGIEATLPKHFIAGARYIMGFSDIKNAYFSSTSQAWMTRSAQVYIGYSIQ